MGALRETRAPAMPSGRRCSRNRARGAAMLEACIVLTVFVSFFGVASFVYQRSSARLAVQHAARRDALFHASHDCDRAPTEKLHDLEPRPPREAHELARREGSGADTKLRGELNSAIASQERVVAVGRLTAKVSSRSWVVCNERPIDGGPFGFFEFGYRFFDSYFSKAGR